VLALKTKRAQRSLLALEESLLQDFIHVIEQATQYKRFRDYDPTTKDTCGPDGGRTAQLFYEWISTLALVARGPLYRFMNRYSSLLDRGNHDDLVEFIRSTVGHESSGALDNSLSKDTLEELDALMRLARGAQAIGDDQWLKRSMKGMTTRSSSRSRARSWKLIFMYNFARGAKTRF